MKNGTMRFFNSLNFKRYVPAVVGFFCYCEMASADVTSHVHHDLAVPVATAVQVPSGYSLIYLSGKLPRQVNEASATDVRLAYGGDTKAQTLLVLEDIRETLLRLGLAMKDIVKVQVFLVGDPELDNQMDVAGFSEAYSTHFSRANTPNLPSRTLVQVAGLAKKGMLVEIEVTAVKKESSSWIFC